MAIRHKRKSTTGYTWLTTDLVDGQIGANTADGTLHLLNAAGNAVYTFKSTYTKSDVGLGNVENTALSAWAGSTNLTTLGTITTGTWSGGTIALNKGGTGATTQAGAANAILPSQTGNSGKYLTTDGSNVSWGTVSGGSATTLFDTDCLTSLASSLEGWTGSVSGTGAAAGSYDTTTFNSTINSGIWGGSSGSTTTGKSSIMARIGGFNTTAQYMHTDFGTITIKARFRLDALSDGTNTYFAYMGLTPGQNGMGSAEPTDGVYFRYTDANNSGRWQGVCRSASTESVVNGGAGQAIVAQQWDILKIVKNAAGTSVEFFVNGTSIGSVTTNIPTAALAPEVGIRKTAGTNGRFYAMDYFKMTTSIER